MRIGYDAKRMFNNRTGLGNYARTLIRNFHDEYPVEELFLFTPSMNSDFEGLSNQYSKSVRVIHDKGLLSNFRRSFGFERKIKDNRLDVFHGLSHELPRGINKTNVGTVVTVHDLIHLIRPADYSNFNRSVYKRKLEFSCNKADRIIAISEHTKHDLIRLMRIPEEKIDVVYQACLNTFYTIDASNKDENKHRDIPDSYFLYVGSIVPRKNLRLIALAYTQIPKSVRIPIVIVGSGKKHKKELLKLIKKLRVEDCFIWKDDINNTETLKRLYEDSVACIYPSLYEGFGLPVVEATLAGTAVITSHNSALVEAAGPEGIFVYYNDHEELAILMQKVQEDPVFRKEKMELARSYVQRKFDPQSLTKQLFETYQKVIL